MLQAEAASKIRGALLAGMLEKLLKGRDSSEVCWVV